MYGGGVLGPDALPELYLRCVLGGQDFLEVSVTICIKCNARSKATSMKLRTRLALLFVAGILPLIGMEIYNSYALYQARRTEIEQLAISQAQQGASELDQVIEGITAILTTVSEAPIVQRRDTAQCNEFLIRILARREYLASLAVTDQSGIVVCSTNLPKELLSIADRPYYQAAFAASEAVIGEYIIGKLSQVPLLPVALPVRDTSGEKIGVAVATLNLNWLSRHLQERGVPPGGSITVADRNGTILARQPDPDSFVGTQFPSEMQYLLHQPVAGAVEILSQDGNRRILGYVPLHSGKPAGLYLSTGLSYDASFGALYIAAWRQFAMIALSVVLTLLAGWVASNYFLKRPVETILRTSRNWQKGDVAARTHMKAGDGEIDEIGAELDRTVAELSRRQETIDVLMREASHRSKNQITLILSIARQIGKNAHSVEGFENALSQRLTALSVSQDLLRQPGEINVRNVLNTQLQVFSLEGDDKIIATGPPIAVEPETGRLLGMAFHELVTNAKKHGALSTEGGSIKVSWSIQDDGQRTCRIRWQEQNGPPVKEPKTNGFGRLLIEKVIPGQLGGTTELAFKNEGLIWQLEYPMNSEVTTNEP